MILSPEFVATCQYETRLIDSMEKMLIQVQFNLEIGYYLHADHIISSIERGMTLDSFNRFVQNLNRDLARQYENIKHGSNVALIPVSENNPMFH